MGDPESHISVGGWLARVTTPGLAEPRWFVVALEDRQEAEAGIREHPDVRGDQIEIVQAVTLPNMMSFDVRPGEVKQIDAP